jgi:hypothetical protein
MSWSKQRRFQLVAASSQSLHNLTTAIMIIASILTGRLLGPELHGQYTPSLVFPQLIFLFTGLDINQGIIKFATSLIACGFYHFFL